MSMKKIKEGYELRVLVGRKPGQEITVVLPEKQG
jgi:hypothetical protein